MMPKGYVIFTEAVHDEAKMGEYLAEAVNTVGAFDGKAIVFSRDMETIEGAWHGNQIVTLEFPSVEKAKDWYNSDAYQAIINLRLAAAECNAIIVGGTE